MFYINVSVIYVFMCTEQERRHSKRRPLNAQLIDSSGVQSLFWRQVWNETGVRIQNKTGNGRSSDETRHREESHGPEVMAAKHIHPPCDDQVPAVCQTCPRSDTPYRVWKRADGGIIIGWWAAGAPRGLMEHLRRDNQPPWNLPRLIFYPLPFLPPSFPTPFSLFLSFLPSVLIL